MTTPPPLPSSSSPPPSIPNSLILGLSGVSSSGKTTIATHLLSLFSSVWDVTLVHADDFYRPEASLPFRAGHRDWDCAAALDLPALCACLDGWLHRGEPVGARPRQGVLTPVGEDGRDASAGNHTEEEDDLLALARRLREEIQHQAAAAQGMTAPPRLLILDGFLLFPSPPLTPQLPSLLHVKILLRATRAAALARRLSRPGYVTLDGFWADPPGYFEDVVWPRYAESHGRYFDGGDVEGDVDGEVCAREGVLVGPREDGVAAVLDWVVGVVRAEMGIVRNDLGANERERENFSKRI